MKLLAALISVLACLAAAGDEGVEPPSIEQRGRAVFRALDAKPVDAAALKAALADIGHVELSYRSEPLKKWADGCQIIDGLIYQSASVALNRPVRGDAPVDWIDKLAEPVQRGYKATVLKLAIAPSPQAAAQRDKLLAEADKVIRAGLLELAGKFPQLKQTSWGSIGEALAGQSPAGEIALWAAHYSGDSTGIKAKLPANQAFNCLVVIKPINWGAKGGTWSLQQMYPNLALQGTVVSWADDPTLNVSLKALVAQALVGLERLDKGLPAETASADKRETASAPGVEIKPAAPPPVAPPPVAPPPTATAPPTVRSKAEPPKPEPAKATSPAPATEAAAPASSDHEALAKRLKASLTTFSLDLDYCGPQDKPFYSLAMRVLAIQDERPAFHPAAELSKAQAEKLIDHLAASGWLSRASSGKGDLSATGPCYVMTVTAGDVVLSENLGWGPPMLRCLDGIRKALEGDAAKTMDTLLGRLSGFRAAWSAQEPATKPG